MINIFLFLPFFMNLAIGQQSPSAELASIYSHRAGQYNCKSVQSQIRSLIQKNEVEVKEDLDAQIKTLEGLVDKSSSLSLQSALLASISALKDLKGATNPKKKIRSALEALCKGSKAVIRGVGNTLALANSILFHTALIPLNAGFRVVQGLTSDSESKQSDDLAYRVFSPKNGIPSYLLYTALYQARNYVFGLGFGFYLYTASFATEMIVNNQCYRVNSENKEREKFCNSYTKIRQAYWGIGQKSHRLGKRIRARRDRRIMNRNLNKTHEWFCSLKRKKQMKHIKSVLRRHKDYLKDKNIEAILPVQKNNCALIAIRADKPESIKTLEGVKIITIEPKKDLNDYYFTSDELDQMTFTQRVCHQLDTEKMHYLKLPKANLYKDFVKTVLAPQILSHPFIQKVETASSMLLSENILAGKSIIFSLGTPVPTNIKSLNDEYLKLSKRNNRYIKKLKKANGVDRCLNLFRENKVDEVEFMQISARLKQFHSDPVFMGYIEKKGLKKFFSKKKKKLNFTWDLVETNNIESVLAAVRSKSVLNVVVVSHGKRSGHIVDSYGQEFPKVSFSSISPGLMSLSFYSCYSDKIVKRYDLVNQLLQAPSVHYQRVISNVEPNQFMNDSLFAPLTGFGYFMQQLDRELFNSFKGNVLYQAGSELEVYAKDTLEDKSCSVSFDDIKILEGSYAISLNEEYLGVISAKSTSSLIHFPCSYLQDSNQLRISSIRDDGVINVPNYKEFEVRVNDKVLEESILRLESLMIFNFGTQLIELRP